MPRWMRKPLTYVALFVCNGLFLSGSSSARANDSKEPAKNVNRVASLAREYRDLRATRRQLPQGVRLGELEDSGGRLNRILADLGVELGRPPHTKRSVIELLGEPDAIFGRRKMRNYLGVYDRGKPEAVRQAQEQRNRTYLIYWWRGWHDFLFFISEEGVIVDHGWWFAYE